MKKQVKDLFIAETIPLNNDIYKNIIQTAILTAYPRTLTDIPYSQEIFSELQKIYGEIDSELIIDKLTPGIEARHKLIDKLISKHNIPQALELAAGFTSRGLVSSTTQNINYIELDLPPASKIKKDILNNISAIPDNLNFIEGNALRKSDFEEAATFLNKGQEVTVINEGLLRYLDFNEKAVVAQNIKYILERFGGFWITSDLTLKKRLTSQNDNMQMMNSKLIQKTQRSYDNFAFEDFEQAEQFFYKQGFKIIERHPFTEIKDELHSLKKLNLAQQDIDASLSHASVYVMQLTKQN